MLRQSARFTREQRLLNAADFQAVFNKRQSAHNACFGVYACKREKKMARLGLVVSKKVSKRAVDRNRIKRLCRETFRLVPDALQGHDFVIVAKQPVVKLSSAEAAKALSALWPKAIRRCKR